MDIAPVRQGETKCSKKTWWNFARAQIRHVCLLPYVVCPAKTANIAMNLMLFFVIPKPFEISSLSNWRGHEQVQAGLHELVATTTGFLTFQSSWFVSWIFRSEAAIVKSAFRLLEAMLLSFIVCVICPRLKVRRQKRHIWWCFKFHSQVVRPWFGTEPSCQTCIQARANNKLTCQSSMLWKQDPCCRSDLVVVILSYVLAGNQQGRLLILVIFNNISCRIMHPCQEGQDGYRYLAVSQKEAEGQNA